MSRVASDGRSIRTRNRPPIQPNPQDITAVVTSSALPTGASTSAKQDVTNVALDAMGVSLESIDASLGSLSELVAFARGGFVPSEPTLPFLVGAS